MFRNRTTIFVLIFFSQLLVASQALSRLAMVTGVCELEGQTDHSGSIVVFTANSPTAHTDSTVTNALGEYSIGLSEGFYSAAIFHDGFLQHVFPDEYFFDGAGGVMPATVLLSSPTITVAGAVSGIWTSDSIYLVEDELSVAAGDSLIVMAGTEIRFMGPYSLTISGSLIAIGADGDSIVFTSGMPSVEVGDWGSVSALSGSYVSLDRCIVEYGNGVSLGGGSTGRVVSNRLQHNGVGLTVGISSPAGYIFDNDIDQNVTGVNLVGGQLEEGNRVFANQTGVSGYGSVKGNRIFANGSGVSPLSYDILIEDNEIFDNDSAGFLHSGYTESFNAVLRNNLIINNSFAVRRLLVLDVTENTFVNSGLSTTTLAGGYQYVISGNIFQDCVLNLEDEPGELGNNLFWNTGLTGVPAGAGTIITTNANSDSCDTYYNIFLDPEFVSPSDYHLLSTSPAIDAGADSLLDADGTRRDLGAFPFYQGTLPTPAIDFTASPTSGSAPLGVDFTPVNTGGPITTWLWSFGDGTTSTSANPVHTYMTDSITVYDVSLSVIGPGGVDETTKPDFITATPYYAPPVARFLADPLDGIGPVQFSDLSLGLPTTWLWDFGDGTTATSQNPQHTYLPGTYTVSLEVANSNGTDSLTKNAYITVRDPETVVAAFEATPVAGTAPLDVLFTNSSIGTISGYEWDFGDGTGSTELSPVHVFADVGTYQVRLVAFGPANSDTATSTIEAGNAAPTIGALDDVAADQGGQLRLTWLPSFHDAPGGDPVITGYGIYRRQDTPSLGHTPGSDKLLGWDSLGWVDAHGDSIYQYVAPTLCDSTEAAGPCWSTFMLRATTSDPFVYFDSAPDSGYSVDNISPAAPGSVAVTGSGLLTWDSSSATDLQFYSVYGSPSAQLDSIAVVLAQTASTSFDVSSSGVSRFLVTATDYAGNESEAGIASISGWTDIASGSSADSGNSTAVAFGDFDSDGDDDLYLVKYGPDQPNVLLVNDGSGSFTDCTPPLLADTGTGISASWADFDHDGDLDLFVGNLTGANRLFENIGAGSTCWEFREIVSGEISYAGETAAAAWVDYDHDGWIEVYVSNRDGANQMLNSRYGFTNILPLGLDFPGASQSFGWCDFDVDMDADLFLVTENTEHFLFNQTAERSFTQGSVETPLGGQGASWGDYDNDGDFDVYVTYWAQDNRLLENTGNGQFVQIDSPVVEKGYFGQSATWGDFDNDGFLDLYVATQSGLNSLYRNLSGSGQFELFSDVSLEGTFDTIGAAWSDVDGDGDLDLYVGNKGGANRLLRNDLNNGNNWLKVRLLGHPSGGQSNGSALGAIIKVEANGQTMWRSISADSGYASQSSLTQHFGLGNATAAEKVTVYWPFGLVTGGHHLSEMTDVAANQAATIVEPSIGISYVPGAGAPSAYALNAAYPNPFNPQTTIAFELPEKAAVVLRVFDLSGRLVRLLVDRDVLEPGRHQSIWDGRDGTGRQVASGTYFYRLDAGEYSETRRMALIK